MAHTIRPSVRSISKTEKKTAITSMSKKLNDMFSTLCPILTFETRHKRARHERYPTSKTKKAHILPCRLLNLYIL